MQLVEVMVAATVFAMASGSSVQLWSRAAMGSQRVEFQHQQRERIELDRLQLQARWQQDLRQPTGAAGCAVCRDQLITVAERVPVPPQLRRALLPADQADALLVRWWVEASPALQRERLFTPAGLGLCDGQAAGEEPVVVEEAP